MKVIAARVIVCSPGRNFVTLKIETDQGLTGLGDASLNGRELAVASYLTDHVIPCLIGRDAHQIEDIMTGKEPRPPAGTGGTPKGDAGTPKKPSGKAVKPRLDSPAGEH